MFFRNYGQVWHTLKSGEQVLLNDLTKMVQIPAIYKNDPRYSITHTVLDGETPDILSYRLYDDVKYFWTVFLLNDIYDYDNQWPRDPDQLEAHMAKKYPFQDPDSPHHYLNPLGHRVGLDAMRLKANQFTLSDAEVIGMFDLDLVTIREYEDDLNEQKRNIKMIDPVLVGTLEDQMRALLNA